MNIRINFKQGLRRIVLSFIGLCVVCALLTFIFNGFSFSRDKYIFLTQMNRVENNIEFKGFNLEQHIEKVLYGDKQHFYIYTSDINCHPYKGYCTYKDWVFKRNKTIKMYNYTEHKDCYYKFKAPTAINYLCWQIWDFLKIFLIAVLVYGCYLLFELVFCWIIKGFKVDKD